MSETMTTPRLRVANARDLGPQFVDNPNRMVGQDGAFSIPLDKHETLWFFGDTLVGTRPTSHSIWQIDGQVVGPWDMSGRGTFERMINNTALDPAETNGPRRVEELPLSAGRARRPEESAAARR